MKAFVDLSAMTRLVSRVQRLGELDATPLMATWMNIIEEDNRKGVMAGTDKDGAYMVAVTYRPKTKKPVKIGSKAVSGWRNNAPARSRQGAFAGFGRSVAGLNNNLRTDQYQQLAGPPLAPRGVFSRVITNLVTGFAKTGNGLWEAYGLWKDVVDKKGRPFLQHHFNGDGRLPIRDLRGVRPEGREKARRSALAWMADQIRFATSGTMNRPAA